MTDKPEINEKFLRGLLVRVCARINRESELSDEEYALIESIVREDFETALLSVDHGYDLSGLLGYSFDGQDLSELARLHREGKHREKIIDLLEDCNFHTACGDFSENRYSGYIIEGTA